METIKRTRELDEQIKNIWELINTASETGTGSVCRLFDELDQVVFEKRHILASH